MNRHHAYRLLPLLLLAGCTQGGPPVQMPPPQAPEVRVTVPVRKSVTDYEDCTGRTEAIPTIEVRARVTGYLEKVYFKDGANVKKGDVLFEIDPRPYKAEVARAEANVVQSEAHLTRLNADFQRANVLLAKKAIGREEYDKIAGDRAEAQAAVGVAKSARDLAQLNLNFTKVTAPITGLISRKMIDPGNMVKADETALTTIVSIDPIYAYFDVDERTLLRLRRMMDEGQFDFSVEKGLPVNMGLADEEGFPHQGAINFVDNKLDTSTGTIHMRAEFPNKRGVLTPGLFVRMRVPIGAPHPVLMVPEEALGTDQGQKFLYVVGPDNKVESRRVKVGRLYEGLRVINDGVKEGERIVVSGVQRVRQGIQVVPLPVGETAGADKKPAAEKKG